MRYVVIALNSNPSNLRKAVAYADDSKTALSRCLSGSHPSFELSDGDEFVVVGDNPFGSAATKLRIRQTGFEIETAS